MTSVRTPGNRIPPAPVAETPADLRVIEAAAKETPPRLRNLEQRWRQQRRACLGSKLHATKSVKRIPQDAASTLQKSMTSIGVATHRTFVRTDMLPLLAAPLPVGTHTISLDVHLIVSAPSSPSEMTILLPNKKVTVVTGGRQMVSVSSDLPAENDVICKLDLDFVETWDAEDVEQWTTVAQLLMKMKSRLPLLKMYLPDGHLSLMSNQPPDLILSTSVTVSNSTGSSSLEGRLRLKYSRQAESLRSSLRLTSPQACNKEPDILHIHRQLSLSHLTPAYTCHDSSSLVETGSRQGIRKLSRFEEDGLRLIQQMRPVWETIERQRDQEDGQS